jgi:hypothetical protein
MVSRGFVTMIKNAFGDWDATSLTTSSEQILAAHAGLPGHACGDHHDGRVDRVRVVVRSDDAGVEVLDGPGFPEIQSLPLRHALYHIKEHDVA